MIALGAKYCTCMNICCMFVQCSCFLWIFWQNYSLLEQTLDILIKKLMKISKVDITVDS